MATDAVQPEIKNSDAIRGFGFALTAYLFWGILPLYMKALAHISAFEVIAHRIVWSVPVAGIVLLALGRLGDIKVAFRNRRTIAMASLTAALVTINWGTYVWAIGAGHSLDAALGYFINPLFSIALGAILLKEKLAPTQVVAICLAAIAVIILTVKAGTVPWVALTLTLTWGFYAFFRKTLPVGANQGFFIEVLLLCIPAALYILYLEARGEGHFYQTGLSDTGLLLGCGLVTALPLMIFANGAKLLRMSTIGIMQYIAPTMVFLIAVFLFKEPFDTPQLIAFSLIWAGLVLYSWSMLRQSRER
ncbi:MULTISPECIES: EamA family transporter RarD [unclassified Rhizobium]|uniref:EamA family transporter RarD n=1 Tax=unclassified Rhizobium TaxID=2613769 RepID=UPI00161C5C58|nr:MULTISPECIES: EamA family transporter RarD [unclassified Rhizobium]MBB3288239.1 chloramphenicol-sensitive protein RarD [Rhizobium sp. BK252]MBB3402897.1 chloramphenicol-sensitive protein RarD [Rhizobium sp. BK289]MBB3415474.1 chloramphenicol-sensitive protein RarD [Rhizobium sp. BK284]MBB3483445.1 chloramphenicol-sensitive protein RarD [Rhizobium sp. BK347]MDK4723469.1 EamA family transporter RarD [Rhizobium sp. CNPSo 3968]